MDVSNEMIGFSYHGHKEAPQKLCCQNLWKLQ